MTDGTELYCLIQVICPYSASEAYMKARPSAHSFPMFSVSPDLIGILLNDLGLVKLVLSGMTIVQRRQPQFGGSI